MKIQWLIGLHHIAYRNEIFCISEADKSFEKDENNECIRMACSCLRHLVCGYTEVFVSSLKRAKWIKLSIIRTSKYPVAIYFMGAWSLWATQGSSLCVIRRTGEIHGIKEFHVPCSLTYRRHLVNLQMVSRCSLEWEVIYFIWF